MKAKGVAAYLRLNGNTAGCTVEDISAGGMFLRTDRVVPVGTHLAFDLVDPAQEKAVSISATVVGIILKEAAEKRGVPQGLRLRFNRQPGATQAYLQKLLGRLGVPQSDAPVFYAVTQQPPRARVDLQPAGSSLPKLRREALPEIRMAPPMLEGPPKLEPQRPALRPAGADAPESTRAAPDEELFSPAASELGEEPLQATDTELQPQGSVRLLGASPLEELGTIPELKRPAPAPDPDATAFELSPPASVVEAPRPASARKAPSGEKRAAAVSQLDAAGVFHDVTAYRAALAEREADGAQAEEEDELSHGAATAVSELMTLRQKVATLEEALHAREERISDLEAELLSLRYQLEGDGSGEQEAEAEEAPAPQSEDDLTPVPAPAPRRRS